jgi:hypothetical protein
VWLLLNNNNNIAWLSTRIFISLAVKYISLIVRRTFVDLCVYDLLFFHNFFSKAGFTLFFVINHFTLTSAFITRTLWLSVHPRSNHLHSSDHTSPLTTITLLYCTVFASFALTFSANSFSINSNFGLLTRVYFFQSHFQRVLHWLHFFGTTCLLTPSTHSAKHLAENIIHSVCPASSFF